MCIHTHIYVTLRNKFTFHFSIYQNKSLVKNENHVVHWMYIKVHKEPKIVLNAGNTFFFTYKICGKLFNAIAAHK